MTCQVSSNHRRYWRMPLIGLVRSSPSSVLLLISASWHRRRPPTASHARPLHAILPFRGETLHVTARATRVGLVAPTCSARSLLLDLNLSALLLFLLWRRHGDFQNTVFESRLGLVRLSALRERNGARKTAVAALASVISFTLLFLFLLALAAQHDHVVADFDIHVVFSQPRQSAHTLSCPSSSETSICGDHMPVLPCDMRSRNPTNCQSDRERSASSGPADPGFCSPDPPDINA